MNAKRVWIAGDVRPCHDDEHFRWEYRTFDVATLLRDICDEVLTPSECVILCREDIEGYCKTILRIDEEFDLNTDRGTSVSIDREHLEAITEEDLTRPLVIAYLGPGEGCLSFQGPNESADFALIDGNHRIAKAYHLGTDELLAFIVNEEQSRAYLLWDSHSHLE